MPQVLSRSPDRIDVFGYQRPQHFQCSFYGLVDIEHLGDDGLFAGESQELPISENYSHTFIEIEKQPFWDTAH
jgi:hypothetical protein